jgi:hypothetical protein
MTNIPILPGTLSNVIDPDNHNNTDPTIELEDTSSYNLINPSASTNSAPPEAIEASISLQPTSQSTTTALDQLKHCLPIFNASHHNDKTEPVELKLSINSIETPPVNSVWLQDNNFLAVTIKSLYSAAYKFNDFLKDHDPFPFPAVAAQLYANLYGMQNNYNTINNFQTAPSFSFNSQIATTNNYGQAPSNSLTGSNVYQMPSVGNYQSPPASTNYYTSLNPVSTPPAVSTTYYTPSYSNPISTPPSNFYAGPSIATPVVAPSYSPGFSSTAPLYSPSLAPTNTFAPTYTPSLSPSLAPVFAPFPSPVDDLRKSNPLFTPTPTYIPTDVQDANIRLKERERAREWEKMQEELRTFPTLNPTPTIPTPAPINFADTAPTLGSENFGSTHTHPTIFTEPTPAPRPTPAPAPDADHFPPDGWILGPDYIFYDSVLWQRNHERFRAEQEELNDIRNQAPFIRFDILYHEAMLHEVAMRTQAVEEIAESLKNLYSLFLSNNIWLDKIYIQRVLVGLSVGSIHHLMQSGLAAEILHNKAKAQAAKQAQAQTTSSGGGGGKDCDNPAAQAEFDKIPATYLESEYGSNDGHMHRMHVRHTLDDFLKRFAMEPGRKKLSSFTDRNTAQMAYQEVLKQAKKAICDWLSGNVKVEEFVIDLGIPIGYGMRKGDSNVSPRHKVLFKFEKTSDGPRVVTGYPVE